MAKDNDEILGDFFDFFLFIRLLDGGEHMSDQVTGQRLDSGARNEIQLICFGDFAKEICDIFAIVIFGGEFAKSVIVDVGIDVHNILHRLQVLGNRLLDQIPKIELVVNLDQNGGVNFGKQFVGNRNGEKCVENGGRFLGELDVVAEIDEIEDLRDFLEKYGDFCFVVGGGDFVEFGSNLVDKNLCVVEFGKNGGFESRSLPFVLFRLGLFENSCGGLNLSRFLHDTIR